MLLPHRTFFYLYTYIQEQLNGFRWSRVLVLAQRVHLLVLDTRKKVGH